MFGVKHKDSCSQVFFKLSVLKNFATFTRKHMCSSPFFNKEHLFQPNFNRCSTSILLQTSENFRFLDVFRVYRSGTLVQNKLKNTFSSCFWRHQPDWKFWENKHLFDPTKSTFQSYRNLFDLDFRAKNYKLNIKRENFLQSFFSEYD